MIGEPNETDEDGQIRNASVYDDQEFYNSLLNQYAALSMNRSAAVIKQRHSKKKEIQRKASKGRRMIFTVGEGAEGDGSGPPEASELLYAREVSSNGYRRGPTVWVSLRKDGVMRLSCFRYRFRLFIPLCLLENVRTIRYYSPFR